MINIILLLKEMLKVTWINIHLQNIAYQKVRVKKILFCEKKDYGKKQQLETRTNSQILQDII